MLLFYALVGCAALATIALCDDPSISDISKEQIKNIDEQVEFNCTVQNNSKNYKVLWYKLDKDRSDRVLLTAGVERLVPDERFSVNYDNRTSAYSLRIDKLQESDTGFYQCQIQLSVSDKVSAEVELQIRRAPTICGNTTQSVDVTEGWPLELHCYADGYPNPGITWKRAGNVLLSTGDITFSGNVLKIPQTSKDDRGVYVCVADNTMNETARANATVRVEFKPVVTPVRLRVGQAPGYDVGLECGVEAFPAPTISWHRMGVQLKKEQIKAPGDAFVDTLQRYAVGEGDYGEYVCRAENKHGSDEARIELFEAIVPVCDPTCG